MGLHTMNRQRGDWMRLSCGDLVSPKDDPRHVGRVEAIRTGYTVTVRWQDSGWISEVPLSDLTRIKRDPSAR
jgi:hypothetical protein